MFLVASTSSLIFEFPFIPEGELCKLFGEFDKVGIKNPSGTGEIPVSSKVGSETVKKRIKRFCFLRFVIGGNEHCL